MRFIREWVLICLCAAISSACSTEDLSSEGERVVASRNPPAEDCNEIGHFVGHEGGWDGDWIANDDLITGAFNDLRNQAGKAGANYVQHDPPTLGQTDGTTTTATVSGTAFLCPK